jgi:hypothetical protein
MDRLDYTGLAVGQLGGRSQLFSLQMLLTSLLLLFDRNLPASFFSFRILLGDNSVRKCRARKIAYNWSWFFERNKFRFLSRPISIQQQLAVVRGSPILCLGFGRWLFWCPNLRLVQYWTIKVRKEGGQGTE